MGDKEKYIAKITNFCQFKYTYAKKMFAYGLYRMVTKRRRGALGKEGAPRIGD